MVDPVKKGENNYIWYAIVVLCAILIVLGVYFVRDYLHIRRLQIVNARELFVSNILKQHGPPTPSEASFIGSWMTFDYVNRLFGIPSDYLKNTLQINDAEYPRMTLSGYAHRNSLNVATFLEQVQAAVRNYLATGSSI